MQITIHDNQLNKIGFLNNGVPGLPSFFNDTWHRYLVEGASTFNFSVNKFKNGVLQDYCQYLNDQAYISFTYEGEDFLFSVLTSEETDDVITLNCATLNLELRNEQANPLVNSSSHNIIWYFDTMGLISYSQISLGINEVSNLTRTINYDGQESKLSRLLSVIGNFDAEFEFVTSLNDDGTLKGITLNLYKANDGVSAQGVGTWRNDVTLYFGKNVSEVRRTIDRTQIFNATTVKGADGLSWKSSEWSVKNEDGREEFYKRKGDDTAYAPLSAELYPSQIQSTTRDIWIRKDFETEYKNVNDMWGYALSQFKKYAYSLVTYEVNASSRLISQEVGDGKPLSIGDTVRIQDENFNAQTGGLILQARVSELEISFSNPSNNKLTFSNYVELESGISDDLESRLAQLIKDSTPYRAELTTTNGVQFKNGTGTTTLGAHIYFGSDVTETIADSYEWSKDGTVVAPTQTITVDASGVGDKAVYSFKATVAGKVVASQSVTITNVNDGKGGADGKTSYTHVAWANNITGTDGFTTVYPNLNLLKNTKSQSYTSTGTANNNSSNNYPLDGIIADILNKPLTITYSYAITNSSGTWSGMIRPTYGLGGTNQSVSNTNLSGTHKETVTLTNVGQSSYGILTSGLPAGTKVTITNLKVEFGSTTTPHMPSASEVTTADWPSYIGQYSDFTTTASTDPTKYAPWTVFKGNDGVGIKTTVITYAISISGTIAPTTGWTSSVPSLVKGLYLWTKTVWTYTDNSSETGYSVTYISKDGNNGNDGIAGKDGVGILTTTITYAGSTSGTTAPTSGWTATVPTVEAGSYLWTKTVWAYTDNTSETGYSVAKMGSNGATGPQGPQGLKGDPGATGIPGQAGADGKTSYLHIAYATNSTGTDGFDVSNATGKTYIGQYTDFTSADSTDPSKYTWSLIKGDKGDKGDQGVQGLQGPAGSNGDPGKIVSDTEPTTPFKGLTWKYSGITDLTASDGTVILSGTEYYWSGTNWILSEINAHNINGNNLTITDGEFSSTIIDGPVQIQTEIKDDHLLIYKMDTSHNEIHTIALKSDSGLGMTYQNNDTGEYTSAGVNFQGLFMQNNITNEFARLTPQGTKLSTDVPWTTLSPTNGFSGGSIQFSVQNAVAYFSVSGLGVPAMSANQWYRIATLPTGSSAIPKVDRVGPALGNASVWGFLVNPAGGLYVKCASTVSATSNLVNVLAPFPIG
ncbi:phage tail protein [Lactococcus lactis]|uniref:phage tail protein n=1 Tax=Lactococcus lactis TaxID=1358 RepID=UPI0022E06666|nr:phage tail protein [Lactococcus lactis]